MLRVLHLTDTHVVAREDAGDPPRSFAGAVALVQGRTTTQMLAAVLAAVTAAGVEPDLVLHTGDVTDDATADSYRVIRDHLAALEVPVVAVPGNHDDLVVLGDAFGHDPVPVRWVDAGGWTIVAVDTAVLHQDHGSLTAAALADLDAALSAASGPVLLGLHHPPHAVCEEASCRLEQATELLEVLRSHPGVRAVASGHNHVAEEQEHDGIAFLLSPSTCLQLRHEHPLPEHNRGRTPVGARVIDLHDDGTVTTELIWVSTEPPTR